jgi:hypothetical protein
MGVFVMTVMLMRVRVSHSVVGMFVAMLCARRGWIRMCVVMVSIVMRVLMRVCDGVVSMGVGMLGHCFLPAFESTLSNS